MNPIPHNTVWTQLNRRDFLARLALVAGAARMLDDTSDHTVRAAVAWNKVPVSPMVHANRTVTFQFHDAHAKTIMLAFSGSSPRLMNRNAHGLWEITIGPLPPEIYAYNFVVDGTVVLDALNPWVKTNIFSSSSMFLVPGHPPSLWENCNVPHGVVHRHYYHSDVVGDNRDYYVYTPPGYDPRSRKNYPVLYLLHGYSDQANAWTRAGRANFILDNLIAQGKAQPMVVVMPLGYGDLRIISRTGPGINSPALYQHNLTRFRDTLFKEVMPRIAKQYNIKVDRDHTAIAGLSMGGGESLSIGLNNLNRFAWMIGLSSYLYTDKGNFSKLFPSLHKKANAQIKLLWIACGKQDPIVGKFNHALDAWLTTEGINYIKVWTPGAHAWRVWRGNLSTFAPLLFQPAGIS